MSFTSTHKTALCLIPPENLWEQIQSIRSVHDKAYPRWMPHINLIYPFVPESEFTSMKSRLESIINSKSSFEIEFDQTSFEYFKKGNECTFHLRPIQTKDVVELQQAIENLLPNFFKNKRPFEAHLTLGQTTTSRISDILIEMKSKWKTIKFSIDRICMISREDDPNDLFSIRNQILLVGEKQEQNKEESLPMEISVVEKLPINISSKNSLCIIPSHEFSSRLLHLFEDTSFRPLQSFRIILVEYDENPQESDIRKQLESISKFTVDFGPRSICFNYSTSRLFLKPTDIEPIKRLNLKNNKDFDGTLTLGELDKSDLNEVGNRFTQSWTFGTNEFEVDRVHLIDSNGRFQYTFPLKCQSFS